MSQSPIRLIHERSGGEAIPLRIAVFRALKLGDMLCAVPALRALRNGYPEAEITLVGLPWADELDGRVRSYVDTIVAFPGIPGLPEQQPDDDALAHFFRSMREAAFDLPIQMHGSGRISNGVVARFGARRMAGYYDPATGQPPAPVGFLPYVDEGLELRRLLRLVEHLGVELCGEWLELPIEADECRQAELLLSRSGVEMGNHVVIHVGASVPERRWGLDRFAAVGRVLNSLRHAVVLTRTADEATLTAETARPLGRPATDLAGRTSLGVTAAVIERARLLVCKDTGVSHIADALGVPSVVISTGDNPRRWSPVDRERHRVLCRAEGVDVDEVLHEVRALLGPPGSPRVIRTSRFAPIRGVESEVHVEMSD